jgi:hypothetical protein
VVVREDHSPTARRLQCICEISSAITRLPQRIAVRYTRTAGCPCSSDGQPMEAGMLFGAGSRDSGGRAPRVHAVIGFHIVPPLGDDYIRQTIATFEDFAPDFLIPAHCTGDRFYDFARDAMGDKVIHSAVGTRFVFGA